jgi:hypothetical protein
VLQLWAVGQGVAYSAFGLTSLLDATLAAATLLYQAGHHARPNLDTPPRTFVTTRLQLLDA